MASQEGQAQPELPKEAYFKPSKDLPGVFPEPVIIMPQLEHKMSFIILHGRGSTAGVFAPPLLSTITPSGETLQTAFPHAKLIFLTASRNRATIYKRSYTHQWFDHWHMEEPTKRQDLMRAGLKKSCEYVHGVMKGETELVGKENVVLWGLNQGCATSLNAFLTWDGKGFAAVVGMCGFLPFANHIKDIAGGNNSGSGDEEEEDPFFHSDDEEDAETFAEDNSVKDDPSTQAVTFLKEEIQIDNKTGMVFREVPVFLGHGSEDEKVPIVNGREAKICLDLLWADVKMVEYEGLGHWYSDEMPGDIFAFLGGKLCIE
jgi:predicted esterase